MSFFTRLEARALQCDSLLCVGLDPHPADLEAPTASAASDFCLRLIDATADLAVAFKPNAAFFEAFGVEGIRALEKVIQTVPEGIPVILDAKRGDIASTAQAYARAAFETLKAHAITLSPYLGCDSLEPFLVDAERGVFLLCKTSNPGAADLQDLLVLPGASPQDETGGTVAPQLLYERVARMAQQWNKNDNLGLVVGATHPQAMKRVRACAPQLWFLAPGVGAQGGDLQDALRAGLRADGMGMLLPVSRAISRAADMRQAAEGLRAAINAQRTEFAQAAPPVVFSSLHAMIADGLLEAGCIKFGEFTLKSGLKSPIYLDLRQLVGYPRLLELVASAYVEILHRLSFDRLAALPYAALPIAAAVSLQGNWPMIYPRKEVKEYGTRAEVEGVFQPGECAAVIDDLATTGGSKFEAIGKLTAAGLVVKDVIVLIDRQSGATEALAQAGYRLHAVFDLTQLLDHWEHTARIAPEQIAAARRFIQNTAPCP